MSTVSAIGSQATTTASTVSQQAVVVITDPRMLEIAKNLSTREILAISFRLIPAAVVLTAAAVLTAHAVLKWLSSNKTQQDPTSSTSSATQVVVQTPPERKGKIHFKGSMSDLRSQLRRIADTDGYGLHQPRIQFNLTREQTKSQDRVQYLQHLEVNDFLALLETVYGKKIDTNLEKELDFTWEYTITAYAYNQSKK